MSALILISGSFSNIYKLSYFGFYAIRDYMYKVGGPRIIASLAENCNKVQMFHEHF